MQHNLEHKWTTLKVIFLTVTIFLHPQIPDPRVVVYPANMILS